MIPPVGLMKALAVALEEGCEKVGWDEPPGLYVIFREPLPGQQADLFIVKPFAVQPVEISKDAAQGLLYLSGHLLTGDLPPLIPAEDQKDFAGMAFTDEGYMTTLAFHERGGREIADIPGSLEVRYVHLIDCAGVYYFVDRVRGLAPTCDVVRPGDDNLRTLGNIPVGLRDMMLAIGRQLPPGSMDLDAVATIGVETLEDLIR